LVVVDITCIGSGLNQDPYQIGAYSFIGDSFLR